MRKNSAIIICCSILAATTILACANTTPANAAEAETAPAEEQRFVLTAVRIEGATAYRLATFAPLYADALTREVATSDLVRIATAITDRYRADGYFLSRAVVPPQTGEGGVGVIRVYEGYIGDVKVTGEGATAVRTLFAPLAGSRPLRLSDLDRRLTLANDVPGVRAKAEVLPDLDDPARHQLVIDATLRKVSGSLYVDNRGTRSVGPVQAFGRVDINSVLRPGDQLGLSVLTTPTDPDEFVYGEASHTLAFADGSRLRTTVSASRARDGAVALNNEVGSESRFIGLRWTRPLARDRRHGVWASLAFDSRHVEQDWSNGGYTDDLRVLRAALQADQGTGASSTSVFAQVSQGLDLLGASDQANRRRSRFDADGQFVKFNLQASHYRDIGRHAGIYISGSGQWSPDALLFSEEFAPGGLPYGRAYNYAEISGDSGLAALAELRVGWRPKSKQVTFLQTYSFVDWAQVWNKATAFGARSASFASTGVGVRVTLADRVVLRTEAARPMTRRPFETRGKHWRAFFSLSATI